MCKILKLTMCGCRTNKHILHAQWIRVKLTNKQVSNIKINSDVTNIHIIHHCPNTDTEFINNIDINTSHDNADIPIEKTPIEKSESNSISIRKCNTEDSESDKKNIEEMGACEWVFSNAHRLVTSSNNWEEAITAAYKIKHKEMGDWLSIHHQILKSTIALNNMDMSEPTNL